MNLALIASAENSPMRIEGLDVPKHLIRINGEYIIERTIRVARIKGINEIFCIINENEHELEEYLLSGNFGIPLHLFVKTTSSSIHSLFVLASFLMYEPFILLTTHNVFDENEFSNFLNYSISQKDIQGTIAVTNYIDKRKSLYVEMDKENLIVKFSDKKRGYDCAARGIYYFTPEIFCEMQYAMQTNIDMFGNYLRLLTDSGYLLKGFSFSKIIDLDIVSDIILAEDFLNDLKD